MNTTPELVGNNMQISGWPPMRFKGDNFFMSNMYPLEHGIDTEFGEVPTTEHFYQMSKFMPGSPIREQIAHAESGYTAKRISREAERRGAAVLPDWPDSKIGVMYLANFAKFTKNPDLARKLVDTGDTILVEGNDWGDEYWGVDITLVNRPGLNNLGKILMIIRDRLVEGN